MQLALILGAITLQLNDGISYGVEYDGWQPRTGRHGDEWLLEEIPLHVRGSTGAGALANLSKLAAVMDGAGRRWQGEGTSPLLLAYMPTNSSTTWYSVARPPDDDDALILPARVNDAANSEIDGVGLRLLRWSKWIKTDPSSLIRSGSFEEDWDEWPVAEPLDWVLDVNSIGAAITQSSAQAYLGTYSAFFDECSRDDQLKQEIPVAVGELVRVSGWFYVTKHAARLLVSDAYAPNTNQAAAYADTFTGWQYLSVDLVSVSDRVRVTISGKGDSANRADFYVDNVRAMTYDNSGEPGDVATADEVDNGDVVELAFATGDEMFLSPTKIIVSDVRFGKNHPPATVIVANEPGRIKVIDSADFGWWLDAPFANVNDSATFARGGSVARYTPASTSAARLMVRDYDLEFYSIRRVAIWINARNNSASTTFTLRALSFAPGGTSYARPIVIAADDTPSPQWRYLGLVTSNRDGAFFLDITASDASGTLDIDSIVLVGLDEHVSIVTVDQSENIGKSEPGTLILNHRALSGYFPQTEVIQNDLTTAWGGRGDIAIYTSGSIIEAILLATGGAGNADRWRQTAGSEAVVANDWTASRLPARVVAE